MFRTTYPVTEILDDSVITIKQVLPDSNLVKYLGDLHWLYKTTGEYQTVFSEDVLIISKNES